MPTYTRPAAGRKHTCFVCEQEKAHDQFCLRPNGRLANRLCRSCNTWRKETERRAKGVPVRQPDPAKRVAKLLKAAARTKEWAQKNPERAKLNARVGCSARRAALRRSSFDTPRNRRWIKAIHAAARDFGLQVDHVIPLKGKTISGLHVPWNMQLLSEERNKQKAASFTA